MYVHSLKILQATEVMALFATNVSCVYLLSWVILHEQFVGVRVSNNKFEHVKRLVGINVKFWPPSRISFSN